MNRRGFVGLLAGAATALVVPQLMVPERKIFLPPRGGWPSLAGYTQHHKLVLWMSPVEGKLDVERAPEYGPNVYIVRGGFDSLAKVQGSGPVTIVPISKLS